MNTSRLPWRSATRRSASLPAACASSSRSRRRGTWRGTLPGRALGGALGGQLAAPGGHQQDRVDAFGRQLPCQLEQPVVARQAGAAGLAVGVGVGRVVAGDRVVLGRARRDEDVERLVAQPVRHVVLDDAVLQEGEAPGQGAGVEPAVEAGRQVRRLRPDQVLGVEHEQLAPEPRRDEPEALGRQPRPVGRGRVEQEPGVDLRVVAHRPAVQVLGVVVGFQVAVDEDPGAGVAPPHRRAAARASAAPAPSARRAPVRQRRRPPRRRTRRGRRRAASRPTPAAGRGPSRRWQADRRRRRSPSSRTSACARRPGQPDDPLVAERATEEAAAAALRLGRRHRPAVEHERSPAAAVDVVAHAPGPAPRRRPRRRRSAPPRRGRYDSRAWRTCTPTAPVEPLDGTGVDVPDDASHDVVEAGAVTRTPPPSATSAACRPRNSGQFVSSARCSQAGTCPGRGCASSSRRAGRRRAPRRRCRAVPTPPLPGGASGPAVPRRPDHGRAPPAASRLRATRRSPRSRGARVAPRPRGRHEQPAPRAGEVPRRRRRCQPVDAPPGHAPARGRQPRPVRMQADERERRIIVGPRRELAQAGAARAERRSGSPIRRWPRPAVVEAAAGRARRPAGAAADGPPGPALPAVEDASIRPAASDEQRSHAGSAARDGRLDELRRCWPRRGRRRRSRAWAWVGR